MLTLGAVHALELCGSPGQQQTFLPKMVRGEWTGTMVLTEPQAGSDLARCARAPCRRAITTACSARRSSSPGATTTSRPTPFTWCWPHRRRAPGVRGISLFIVPKFLVNDDGTLGGAQ